MPTSNSHHGNGAKASSAADSANWAAAKMHQAQVTARVYGTMPAWKYGLMRRASRVTTLTRPGPRLAPNATSSVR
ncbi:MAG: hypothetical protein NVSMB18_00560 [Acetobacteraceae bacterium]